MRNLLVLAIALSVILTDEDVAHLGYDVTPEDFKDFFAIPEGTEVDMENMTSEYKHQEKPLTLEDFKRFMKGAEVNEFKKKFPVKSKTETAKEAKANKPATETAKPETAKDDAETKAAKQAEKDAEKAAKQAEKDAANKAKADAKAEAAAKKAEEKEAATKAKEEAKKAKEEAKAAKDAEKAEKALKPLSRSQQMQVYHSQGKVYADVIAMHPEWNQAHVRNALYYAVKNPDVVVKTLEISKKLDEAGIVSHVALDVPVKAETPETPEVPADETESNETGSSDATN